MKSLVIAASLLLCFSATLAHASSDLTLTTPFADAPFAPALLRSTFGSCTTTGPILRPTSSSPLIRRRRRHSIVCGWLRHFQHSGRQRSEGITQHVTYPLNAGSVTMTGSVSSDSSDPNPSDNRATDNIHGVHGS